jgi:hypothetical protein
VAPRAYFARCVMKMNVAWPEINFFFKKKPQQYPCSLFLLFFFRLLYYINPNHTSLLFSLLLSTIIYIKIRIRTMVCPRSHPSSQENTYIFYILYSIFKHECKPYIYEHFASTYCSICSRIWLRLRFIY